MNISQGDGAGGRAFAPFLTVCISGVVHKTSGTYMYGTLVLCRNRVSKGWRNSKFVGESQKEREREGAVLVDLTP